MRASIRPSGAPTQKWVPWPSASWRVVARSSWKASGSGNWRSSRLAEPMWIRTCEPGIVLPCSSTSLVGRADEALRGRVPAGALLGQGAHERRVGPHRLEQPVVLGQGVGDVRQQVVRALEAGR